MEGEGDLAGKGRCDMKRVNLFTVVMTAFVWAFTLNATAANVDPLGEEYLVERLNHERLERGRAPLAQQPELRVLARQKAEDMARNNYFDHISPTLGSVYEMLQNAGIPYKWAGENIARVDAVDVAHAAFMESADHRANILSAGYTQVGVGVVEYRGKIYVCQIFSRPRSGARDTTLESSWSRTLN